MSGDRSNICFICGMAVESETTSIVLVVHNEKRVMFHTECLDALRNAIREVAPKEQLRKTANAGVAQLVGNQWILTRRNLPNQNSIVLVFFDLHDESPKSTDQLTDWLKLNNLRMSNPSMVVKRLTDREALAVIKGEDGVLRYFITPRGREILEEHLGTESN